MKFHFGVTLVLLWMCLFGVGQGLSVSKGNAPGDVDGKAVELEHGRDKVNGAQTEEEKILELERQVSLLQQSVAEITQSFSTLELATKNPSMMTMLHLPDDVHAKGEKIKTRRRREDTDQTSSPASSPSDGTPNINSWTPQQYLNPMFSGQCFLCPPGAPGPQGPPGPQGAVGRDGRDGRDAALSPQAPEIPTLPDDVTPAPIPYVENPNRTIPGVVYTRWGQDACPDGAELIYSGSIGGARSSHSGSGSNYLCMPDEPIYDETSTVNTARALLYSSEYQTNQAVPRLQPRHDHTPTCAVCRAPSGRTTKLMIPARNVCPSEEWRLEYAGYLMAERYTHQRTEFVCVDREMVVKAGTAGNQDGVLLYMVEARCLVGGGLDCGPYVDGAELTCAVCTL